MFLTAIFYTAVTTILIYIAGLVVAFFAASEHADWPECSWSEFFGAYNSGYFGNLRLSSVLQMFLVILLCVAAGRALTAGELPTLAVPA